MTSITKTTRQPSRSRHPTPAESWREAAQADLAILRQVLRGRLDAEGVTTRAMSETLGYHRVYLHRSLAGDRRLTVKVAFQILEQLEVSPVEVFAEAFVLGGPAAEELRRRRLALGLATVGTQDLAETLRALEEERGRVTPEERMLRAGELLRFLIRARGSTVRAVSRQLGLGQDVLGQVLRGRAELNFSQVFGVLRYLGVGPGRFFFELALSTPPTGVDHPERAAFLDWLEKTYEEASEAMLRELDRTTVVPTRPGQGQRQRAKTRENEGD